jgi:hypothetical protein
MPRLTLGSKLEPPSLLIKSAIRSIQVSYDHSEVEAQCRGFAELVFALQRQSVSSCPKTISRDAETLTAFARHLVATRKGESLRTKPLSVDDVASFVKGKRANFTICGLSTKLTRMEVVRSFTFRTTSVRRPRRNRRSERSATRTLRVY